MARTILRNLVSNAIKYTPRGGRVTVQVEASDDVTVVRVIDTGTGMSASSMERLFEVENRESTPGTDGEQGTGLGLPIIADFVRRNGGTITARSRVGDGSTFEVVLPARESAAAGSPIVAAETPREPAPSGPRA